ncbi:MAG: nuclear transport factor 2 family protein [Hyphomonadaceae bacterium]|nr:nuclear transport factor 2 family protein [Hyphomonadaceae bacterium]
MVRVLLAGAAVLAASASPALAQATPSPIEVVNAFNKLGYEDRRLVEAIETYVAPDFIEHNPGVPGGGREGLLARVRDRAAALSQNEYRILHVFAEGDMVVVHHYRVPRADQGGRAFVDFFRVRDGKIVEHWDVSEDDPLPDQATRR